MRSNVSWVWLLLNAGCSVNLEPWEEEPETSASLQSPRLVGCRPLSKATTALRGRVDSVVLGNGEILMTVEAAMNAGEGGAEASAGAFILPNADACAQHAVRSIPASIDLSALGLSGTTMPLASITHELTYTYFAWLNEARTTLLGFGVARWDSITQRPLALAILWTSDRPNYGSGAIVHAGHVYVFGSVPARFLAADVYVARVPLDALGEQGAYEYWYGGGNWGSRVDQAVALLEGGTEPSVAWDASHRRWLMSYVTPYARTVTLRSGIGLSGPWSRPINVGECDVDPNDAQAYCEHAILHPPLAPEGQLTLTYSTQSAANNRPQSVFDHWPRAVQIPWPDMP